ncbi:hypothetical protein CROQUDRAFT_43296, partial [Cronartium quercuum f. sp. fusiforme G11]
GTPHRSHVCSSCTCLKPLQNLTDFSVFQVIITDGITIGYWHCQQKLLGQGCLRCSQTVKSKLISDCG